jgi:hypothetical protein
MALAAARQRIDAAVAGLHRRGIRPAMTTDELRAIAESG